MFSQLSGCTKIRKKILKGKKYLLSLGSRLGGQRPSDRRSIPRLPLPTLPPARLAPRAPVCACSAAPSRRVRPAPRRACARRAQARGSGLPTRSQLRDAADIRRAELAKGWSRRRWKSSAPPTGETGCAPWRLCALESCYSAPIPWRTRCARGVVASSATAAFSGTYGAPSPT